MKCKYCDSSTVVKFGIEIKDNDLSVNHVKRCFKNPINTMVVFQKNIENIKALVKEGMGIRNISRYLSISTNTTLRKIKQIARQVVKTRIFESNQNYPTRAHL